MHGLLEATIEQLPTMLGNPAIETEGVLVEVEVQMLSTDIALMRPQTCPVAC